MPGVQATTDEKSSHHQGRGDGPRLSGGNEEEYMWNSGDPGGHPLGLLCPDVNINGQAPQPQPEEDRITRGSGPRE